MKNAPRREVLGWSSRELRPGPRSLPCESSGGMSWVAYSGLRGDQRVRTLTATVTGNWQVDWLPEASVAVHVTRVVPRGKKLPEGGTHTTTGSGSSSSLAVTEKCTTSPGGLPKRSSTNTDGGHESV